MSRNPSKKKSEPAASVKGGDGGIVSLKDVAKAARVSVSTASRSLSNAGKVKKETLAQVHAAAEALGYRLNGVARALRSRRTHLVGIVIPTLDYAIYVSQIEALQQTLAEAGYSLLVTCSGWSLLEELKQVRSLLERGVEGLVLVGSAHHPDLIALLEEQNVPTVETYVYPPTGGRTCIGFDNAAVSAKAIDHLVALGHRRIAMVAGITRDNDRAAARVEGVKACLARHWLSLPPALLLEKPYTISAGREALRTLLSMKAAPTAVFCASDVLAFGVLTECGKRGVDVPGQLSVVGFDNLNFCAHLTPALTTIEVPAAAMGRGAARHLIARLSGNAEREYVELEANLILRETTGPYINVK